MSQTGLEGKPVDFAEGLAATSDLRSLCDRFHGIVKKINKEILVPARRAADMRDDFDTARGCLERIERDVNKIMKEISQFLDDMTHRNKPSSKDPGATNSPKPGDRNTVSITGPFYGDVNVGSGGNSSFNKGFSGQDLPATLEGFGSLAKQLFPQVPENKRARFLRSCETIQHEAQSSQPERSWFDLSAAGVIECAKDLGEAGNQLIAFVKAIASMIGFP